MTFSGDPEFYLLNAGVLILPFLAAYFAWTRRVSTTVIIVVAAAFAMTAVILNVYPFDPGGMTVSLAAGHSLVVLWLFVGVAYAGGLWRSDTVRMDFIRFTGEWFVYFTLLALGGAVLVALTMGVFGAIGTGCRRGRGGVDHPVRRRGGGDRGRRSRRGEAERDREHRAGADEAVHTAVHRDASRAGRRRASSSATCWRPAATC